MHIVGYIKNYYKFYVPDFKNNPTDPLCYAKKTSGYKPQQEIIDAIASYFFLITF